MPKERTRPAVCSRCALGERKRPGADGKLQGREPEATNSVHSIRRHRTKLPRAAHRRGESDAAG